MVDATESQRARAGIAISLTVGVWIVLPSS